MDIIEKTKELGELIQNSPEMLALKTTENTQNNDETAQKLLEDYNLKRMNASRDMQNGKITNEEAVELLQQTFDLLAENPVISSYLDAKSDFDNLVQQINGVLNYYITGQEPNDCSQGCGSCSGCH